MISNLLNFELAKIKVQVQADNSSLLGHVRTCVYDIQLLAVGTSKGMLCVYQLIKLGKEDLSYRVVVVMKAHLPQLGPQDQRFGQLGKQ